MRHVLLKGGSPWDLFISHSVDFDNYDSGVDDVDDDDDADDDDDDDDDDDES